MVNSGKIWHLEVPGPPQTFTKGTSASIVFRWRAVTSLACDAFDVLWTSYGCWAHGYLKQMIPKKTRFLQQIMEVENGSFLKRNYYWRDPGFFTEQWLWEVSGIYVCNKSKVPIIESIEIISDTSEIRKNHKYQRNKNYTKSSSTSYRYNIYNNSIYNYNIV